MRSHSRVLGFSAAALVLGAFLLVIAGSGTAADDKVMIWKPVVPEANLARLVDLNSQTIQEALDDLIGGKLPKTGIQKVHEKAEATAILIAAYAQSGMGRPGANAKQLATLRDNALKVAETVKAKNYPAAKTQAAALAITKANPSAKTEPIPLFQPADRDDVLGAVMHLFKPRSVGGLGLESKPVEARLDGIEQKLLSLNRKAPEDSAFAKEAPALADLGYQTAILAELALAFTPLKKEGKKDPKDWRQWSMDMRDAAESFTAAAKAQKPKGLVDAAKKLNASCASCHAVFRDE